MEELGLNHQDLEKKALTTKTQRTPRTTRDQTCCLLCHLGQVDESKKALSRGWHRAPSTFNLVFFASLW